MIDFYARGVEKQLKTCWPKYVSQALVLDFLSKLKEKYKGKEAREIIKEIKLLIK